MWRKKFQRYRNDGKLIKLDAAMLRNKKGASQRLFLFISHVMSMASEPAVVNKRMLLISMN